MNEVQALIEAGATLNRWGHVPATSGNFSCRLASGGFVVTASGFHKGFLEENNFLQLNANGVREENTSVNLKPSAETELHLDIYRRFPEAQAILHSHSPMASLVSMQTNENAVYLEGWELLKAFDGIDTHQTRVRIPVVENSQLMSEVCEQLSQDLSKNELTVPMYIIRGHGVYCWSSSVARCLHQLEALEYLLNMITLGAKRG